MYFKEILQLSLVRHCFIRVYDYSKFEYYDFDIDLKDDCLIADFQNTCDFDKFDKSIKDLFYKRVEDIEIFNLNVFEVFICFG